jgi:predicted nucleotidyltransferase
MELHDKEIMQILRQHRDILQKYRVKKIGLFGSYRRGDEKRQSDIDLLVEFNLSNFDKNFTGYYNNYLGLRRTLETIFQKKVDLVTNDMISPYIEPLIQHEIQYLETA